MSFIEDTQSEIFNAFRSTWSERDGQVIPEPEDIGKGNEGVNLDGVVMYADMADSTTLVMTKSKTFAAEIYKAYLLAACRCIGKNDGKITAFDGDRVMAVFIGGSKCTNAVTCAMNISYFVSQIINPYLENTYKVDFRLKHCIGIDQTKLLVAKTGIRKYNDLVWVGNAANHAAKMANFNEQPYNIFITKTIYDSMNEKVKYINPTNNRFDMWESRNWVKYSLSIYRTNYYWKPS